MLSIPRQHGSIHVALARRSGHGFTLVELLVVIVIISILFLLLLPALSTVRESGRRVNCGDRLKQLANALIQYEGQFGKFPPGRMGCDGWQQDVCKDNPGWKRPGTSGFVMILPMLDDVPLYEQFQPFDRGALFPAQPGDTPDGTTDGWKTPQIAAALSIRPEVFVCPSSSTEPWYNNGSYATGCYALVQGSKGPSYGISQTHVKHYNNGMFCYRTEIRRAHVLDGMTPTMFVGETVEGHTRESANVWTLAARHLHSMRSTDNPLNTRPGDGVFVKVGGGGGTGDDPPLYGYKANGAFASDHPGGALFAFGDGHVQMIHENIDLATYRALSTRAEEDEAKLD